MARQKWSAEERLVAEQAVALRRQVVQAMEAPPVGQGLAVTEAAVLAQVPELREKGGDFREERRAGCLLGGKCPAMGGVVTTYFLSAA